MEQLMHVCARKVIFLAVAFTFLLVLLSVNSFKKSFAISDFNIDAVGDWTCSSNAKSTENNIKAKSPELVLGLGDYSMQPTGTCWFNIIKPTDGITKINFGNHDVESSSLLNSYLNHFHLSGQYYSYNYQNVHVLTMATEVSASSSSSQYKFVKNDLQKASQDPNIKWIIVNMHKPLYSSPTTCNSSSCQGSSSLQKTYHPLFDQYQVDLVLDGHTHGYQRTYPIKFNPSNPSSPTKTSTSKSTYTNPTGEIYAIVATGGDNFFGFKNKASFVSAQQANKFGILDVKITNDGSKMEGKFYANDGSTMDTFSITKSVSNPVGYHYDPSLSLSGSNFYDVTSTNALQLSKFSVAAWFKTSADYSSNAFIVNKGGLSSEAPGANLNYGIFMNSEEQIRGGFETSSGANNWVTPSNSFSDGKWHFAVVTFDGSIIRFYIDGVQISSKTTSASPDNSWSHPLRIGADSSTPSSYFAGNVDEVRVWNRALSGQEVSDAYGGTFNTSGQVLYIESSSQISSFKSTSHQIANPRNITAASENGSDHDTNNQTAKTQKNNTHTPELPNIGSNTKISQNKGKEIIAPSNQDGQENKSGTNAQIQKNNNDNLEVKPVIPKEVKKTVQPKIKNIRPDANAGKNQIAAAGMEVTLDGSKSNDRDGKIKSYQWQQISGLRVDLENTNKSNANFVSPPVTHDIVFVFKLTVEDDKGGSDSAITVVRVIGEPRAKLHQPQANNQTILN